MGTREVCATRLEMQRVENDDKGDAEDGKEGATGEGPGNRELTHVCARSTRTSEQMRKTCKDVGKEDVIGS